jgi:hypothetical protein
MRAPSARELRAFVVRLNGGDAFAGERRRDQEIVAALEEVRPLIDQLEAAPRIAAAEGIENRVDDRCTFEERDLGR